MKQCLQESDFYDGLVFIQNKPFVSDAENLVSDEKAALPLRKKNSHMFLWLTLKQKI